MLIVCLARVTPIFAGAPPAIRLTKDGDFKQQVCWSPDGTRLLMTRVNKRQMGIWVFSLETGESKPLMPKEIRPHFDGHWSSDGGKVLFVQDIPQGTDGKLHIFQVGADGVNSTTVIANKSFEESPRWSRNGKFIAFVTARDGNQEIYRATGDGKDSKRLTNEQTIDNNPSWSADGKRIAFCSGRFGNLEICDMDAEGKDIRRLTNHPAMDYWPVFSPDGMRIAFTSNRDGNYEVYIMNADGSNPRNLSQHPGQDNHAAWSPDGKRLAFVSNRGGGYDVYAVEVGP